MDQSAINRGYRVAASRSMTPREWKPYQYDRGMVEALKRVRELHPAPSYSEKFKNQE